MSKQRELLFISSMFLYPVDTGARIRTTQILKGMKGGQFRITLASPATRAELSAHGDQLEEVCDDYVHWARSERGVFFDLLRMRHLFSALPIPVVTDRSKDGMCVLESQIAHQPDVIVIDFPHTMVLMPPALTIPSVLFTHNVEAEIFERHRKVAADPLRRLIWSNQYRKMRSFEGQALRRATRVIAVSDRDKDAFNTRYNVVDVDVIPTGVDLEFYDYQPPADSHGVVFTGSMDWMANIDAIEFLLGEVWPLVVRKLPDATMTVVGRDPSPQLVARAEQSGYAWRFTGWVTDTRPSVRQSAAFVIPLRVGGGTRLKVYEAMAMGCPVVSTSIGVEGLPVEHDQHCLLAESAEALADGLVRVLTEGEYRNRLSVAARSYVEDNFSFQNAANVFEGICRDAIDVTVET